MTDATGEVHTVRARFVVVAADALRTPQVLWASGIRPPALGRTLNDQSQVVYRHAHPGCCAVGADAQRRIRHRRGRSTDRSASRAASAGCRSPTSCPSTVRSCSWMPRRYRSPTTTRWCPGSIVGLGLFCAKDLQWDDRVEFSDDELDWYGMPAMRIHYRLTDRDHAVIERAQAEIVELAEGGGRADRRSARSRCRSALRCTTRAASGWGRRMTVAVSAAPTARSGRTRGLRRGQRGHPDGDRVQPDPDLGRARGEGRASASRDELADGMNVLLMSEIRH